MVTDDDISKSSIFVSRKERSEMARSTFEKIVQMRWGRTRFKTNADDE
jgi:hypothetical protein